jgi:hypothetical protein
MTNRTTYDVELYSLLCDVIERAYLNMPVDSQEEDHMYHTSDYARAAAMRIVESSELQDLIGSAGFEMFELMEATACSKRNESR